MQNPDRQSAHEQRLCRQLDKVESDIEHIEGLPATPLNRLKLIQQQLKAQVLLHSFYQKDKDETMPGLQLLTAENRARILYQQCLNQVTSLIDNHDRWAGQPVDLSTIESWVYQPGKIRGL